LLFYADFFQEKENVMALDDFIQITIKKTESTKDHTSPMYVTQTKPTHVVKDTDQPSCHGELSTN
jgi:hypothetical protein